jgi:hypothetical protein
VYILRYHCGSPCATIAAYSYSGESIWSPDWGIGGFVDFATSGNFMINTGRINMGFGDNTPEEPYLPTVDEIDLTTGEVKVLWEKSERDDYFTPFFMPSISPDERFFSFHYGGRSVPRILYVIDSTGQEYWQYANSFILDWRANNDLAISEVLESGESRLVYLTLTGESEVIFTTEPGTQITGDSYSYYGGGKWSPDDRFFIFTTENYDKGTTQLYLWQPDNGEVRFIVSLNGDKEIYNLTWLPNATTFYFSSGEATYRLETIWRYEIETAD